MSKKKLRKITKANITHVSFVPKGANGQDFLIVKEDGVTPDLQVQSPILKLDDDKHLTTGVVYAPGVVDSQGEFMEADAIEEAAHEFLAKHRHTDVRHNFVTNEDVEIVESSVAKADFELDGVPITKGTWTITAKVNDDKLWTGIKDGIYKGFSMGGTGLREEVEVEDMTIKKEDEQGSVSHGERGLLAVLKEYILGDSVTKADEAKVVIVDFKAKAKARAVDDGLSEARWVLSDAIRGILESDAADKKVLIEQQIDAYKDYVLSELDSAGIEKMSEAFSEPLEKAGKSISGANEAKIKAAYESLGQLLSTITENQNEEETDMKKEELEVVIKEAIAPLTARVEALEKAQDGQPATQTETAEIKKEDISAIIKEALEPLTERITKVEAARGASNQMQQNYQNVEKSNESIFHGLL